MNCNTGCLTHSWSVGVEASHLSGCPAVGLGAGSGAVAVLVSVGTADESNQFMAGCCGGVEHCMTLM